MNFKKHLSQMMKSHVPLRLESHVRTKHNANTRTVWFGHVGTKHGRNSTPSCSWNWFQIVRESLTRRQSEGVLGAGKSSAGPRDVLRGDLSTTCGIAPLRSTPRFCGNWHQFVRESLTSTDEKKPRFLGRGCGLGVSRDSGECRLQVLDEGAQVLDRCPFLLLGLRDTCGQFLAHCRFPC